MKNYLYKNSVLLAAACVLSTVLSPFAVSADNCFEIGQRYARENGASLVAAKEAAENGRAVCELVVLKRAANGQRPKREVVLLPK